nr:MAG TPA: Baseplate wedge protein [Caudoviricetes sp.]
MLDLALNAKTHDLVLNGDVMFIDDVERVAQQIKIQLLTFLGEWFLDVTHGVPYLEYVLVKNPNFTLIRELFREQILKVDGVSNLVSIDIDFESATRKMLLSYEAETEYGMIVRKEVLGYGVRSNS